MNSAMQKYSAVVVSVKLRAKGSEGVIEFIFANA